MSASESAELGCDNSRDDTVDFAIFMFARYEKERSVGWIDGSLEEEGVVLSAPGTLLISGAGPLCALDFAQ